MSTKDSLDGDSDACFCADSSYNKQNGPTDLRSDADPMTKKLTAAIVSRVGGASTSGQSGMADEMSNKPLVTSKDD